MDYCAEPETARYAGNLERHRASDGHDAAWYGGIKNRGAFQAALSIARRGWPEGMRHVNTLTAPMVNALAPAMASDGGWSWDVTGAAYDVGEYLSGAPECWLTSGAPASRPVVTIQSLAAVYGGVDADAINRRGGACVALAMALERAGYAVRIEVVHGFGLRYTPGTEGWIKYVLTDDNGGPLDVDRIIFALIHPAAHRALRHAVAYRVANVSAACFESFPFVRSTCPWDASIALPALTDSAVNWDSPRSVNAWLQNTLDRITKGEN
jgi:hypothetical protein